MTGMLASTVGPSTQGMAMVSWRFMVLVPLASRSSHAAQVKDGKIRSEIASSIDKKPHAFITNNSVSLESIIIIKPPISFGEEGNPCGREAGPLRWSRSAPDCCPVVGGNKGSQSEP